MTWKPDYVTVPDMRAYLDIGDTADDTEIQLWITAASRAVDRHCFRQFGKAAAPVSRVYRRPAFYDRDLCLWVLEIDDLQDTTGFTVNGTAYASQTAVLLPDNAPADGEPWTQLGFTDQPSTLSTLVGLWGWSTTPAQVQGAVRLQCNRWNFRRGAPAGVAGSAEIGSEVRLLARLDPDLATVLIGLARRARAS